MNICNNSNCPTVAYYNFPGLTPSYCKHHKSTSMIYTRQFGNPIQHRQRRINITINTLK